MNKSQFKTNDTSFNNSEDILSSEKSPQSAPSTTQLDNIGLSGVAASSFLSPFDSANNKSNDSVNENTGKPSIHLRVQQRNGRKTLTTIQGIPESMNLNKVLKAFKKEFACNGTVVEDPELGNVIQLQGDHRASISKILVDEKVCKKEDIHIHGF